MTSEEIANALEALLDLLEGSVMLDGAEENARISLSNYHAETIVLTLRAYYQARTKWTPNT